MLTKADIKLVKSLSDKSARVTSGLFVVEGGKMVEEALHSGFAVERVYVTERFLGDWTLLRQFSASRRDKSTANTPTINSRDQVLSTGLPADRRGSSTGFPADRGNGSSTDKFSADRGSSNEFSATRRGSSTGLSANRGTRGGKYQTGLSGTRDNHSDNRDDNRGDRHQAGLTTADTSAGLSAADFIEVVSEKEMERISHLKTPSAALAVVRIPEHRFSPAVAAEQLVLALDDVQDPGNMGTIIRIADWFGITDIVCSAATADCYNPKVVQATMGALFRVRVHYLDLSALLAGLNSATAQPHDTHATHGTQKKSTSRAANNANARNTVRTENPGDIGRAGIIDSEAESSGNAANICSIGGTDAVGQIPIYGTFLDGVNMYEERLSATGIIVMGNEGRGISDGVAASVNRRLFIPPFPADRHGSESLNVATATAITCAEFRRRQS